MNPPLIPPKGERFLNALDSCRIDFRDIMEKWLRYKKEKRQSYRSEESIEECYNNLYKLSNGNAEVASEIVNQSIANNWSGLFSLAEKNQRRGYMTPYQMQKLDREQHEKETMEYVQRQMSSLAQEAQLQETQSRLIYHFKT